MVAVILVADVPTKNGRVFTAEVLRECSKNSKSLIFNENTKSLEMIIDN